MTTNDKKMTASRTNKGGAHMVFSMTGTDAVLIEYVALEAVHSPEHLSISFVF